MAQGFLARVFFVRKKNEDSLVRNNNFDGFWQLSGCAFPFFVLLATEYFCFGGSFVYDMKTSNVGISFDQHDWHYEAKIFMKSFLNFDMVEKM